MCNMLLAQNSVSLLVISLSINSILLLLDFQTIKSKKRIPKYYPNPSKKKINLSIISKSLKVISQKSLVLISCYALVASIISMLM